MILAKLNSLMKKIRIINKEFNKTFDKKRDLLLGEYGELIIVNELEKNNISYEYKGGHAGDDIELRKNNIRLEVKTSKLKHEQFFKNKSIKNWGWKVQSRSSKVKLKPLKYDWVILVKLEENWKNYKLYAIPKKEVKKIYSIKIKRYSNVGKAVYLFPNKSMMKKAIKEKNSYLINRFTKKFNRNPQRFRLNWAKILK